MQGTEKSSSQTVNYKSYSEDSDPLNLLGCHADVQKLHHLQLPWFLNWLDQIREGQTRLQTYCEDAIVNSLHGSNTHTESQARI